jgi:hypothetical protein
MSGTTTSADRRTDRTQVTRLLVDYRRALNEAERLPLFALLASRPPYASALARWCRLPRLTLGTSVMVRHHVSRAVDALLREYSSRAALDGLDDASAADRQALMDFRASVRPVPWRRIVTTLVIALLLVGRGLVELLMNAISDVALGLSALDVDQSTRLRSTADGLLSLSSSLSAKSLGDTASNLMAAGAVSLSILAASLIAAAYVVLRPFSAAFRIKRMIFNLAPEPDVGLSDTCTTWHVSRSTGLYDEERVVMSGLRIPREVPFDLLLSLVVTLLLSVGLASFYLNDARAGSDRWFNAALVAVLLAARLHWICRTYRDRVDGLTGRELPDYRELTSTRGRVDRRPRTEAVPLAMSFVLLPMVMFRLARQVDLLRAEDRARAGVAARHHGVWVPLVLATVSFFFVPLTTLTLLWQMRRMPGAGWRRWESIAALAASGVFVLAYPTFALSPTNTLLSDVTLVTLMAVWVTSAVSVETIAGRVSAAYGTSIHHGATAPGTRQHSVVFTAPPRWTAAGVGGAAQVGSGRPGVPSERTNSATSSACWSAVAAESSKV